MVTRLPHLGAMIGLLLLTATAGCAAAAKARRAQEQAAFDHRCEPGRLQVVRQSDDGRTVELDVCGTVRRYQLISDPTSFPQVWLETTRDPGPASPAP